MLGTLQAVRKTSKKTGKPYVCVRFVSDDGGFVKTLAFDSLIAYQMADFEGVSFNDYVIDETEEV